MNVLREQLNVKNEHIQNTPLLSTQAVTCNSLKVRSFWDINADRSYYNEWPRDRKLSLTSNATTIIYTEKGYGIVELINNEYIHLRGSSVIFLSPDKIKHYWCEGGYWKIYWIEVQGVEQSLLPFEQIIVIDNHLHFHLYFDAFIRAIHRSNELHHSYAASILNHILHEWLLIASNSEISKHEKIIQTLIDEMHIRISENWKVREMAETYKYSEQYLRKIFIKHIGKSPKTYFTELKLGMIRELLKKGGYTISELAELYGFTDGFHLSKVYKKHFGYAPSNTDNSL